eukprot:scaffold12130_cov56-Phaeocystis_antarctica.AAC.4
MPPRTSATAMSASAVLCGGILPDEGPMRARAVRAAGPRARAPRLPTRSPDFPTQRDINTMSRLAG